MTMKNERMETKSKLIGSIKTPPFGWRFSFLDHHRDVESPLGSDKACEVHA